MKKKPTQNEIDIYYDNLPCKVFDLLVLNDDKYYLDKDLNLIWDVELNVVGIIHNKKNYFFDDYQINNIITECKNNILI